jgi:hypothetical protein
MGNKNDFKIDQIYCNQTFTEEHFLKKYKCGSIVIKYSTFLPIRLEKELLPSKHQCSDCEEKERKIKRDNFEKIKINNELINIFTQKEIRLIKNNNNFKNYKNRKLFKNYKKKSHNNNNNKINDNNKLIINFFNENKYIIKKIINKKFIEIGLIWNEESKYYYLNKIYDKSAKAFAPLDGLEFDDLPIDAVEFKKKKFNEISWTLLHFYICNESYNEIKYLLENGADVNIKDDFGISSITLSKILIVNKEIIKLLEEYNFIHLYDFNKFYLNYDINFNYK